MKEREEIHQCPLAFYLFSLFAPAIEISHDDGQRFHVIVGNTSDLVDRCRMGYPKR